MFFLNNSFRHVFSSIQNFSALSSEFFFSTLRASGLFVFTFFLAFGVLSSQSPINALFNLMGVFFILVLFLFFLQIEFISLTYIIVYRGAIAILFLFVIRLLNLSQRQNTLNTHRIFLPLLFFLFIIILTHNFLPLVENVRQIHLVLYTPLKIAFPLETFVPDIFLFSTSYYTLHGAIFLLTSRFLLVARIGAIVLAKETV